MRKCLLTVTALCLTGCAGMSTQEKRAGFTVLGAVAGVALIAAQINAHDEEEQPGHCTTVTRPTGGGGIATNETFCAP